MSLYALNLFSSSTDPTAPLKKTQSSILKPTRLELLHMEAKLPPPLAPPEVLWNREKGKGPSGGKQAPKKTPPRGGSRISERGGGGGGAN